MSCPPPPMEFLELEYDVEEDYGEPPDTTPPQIYLLGEAYIEVDLKAVYVDAGAYAIDARESYVPVTVHGLDALSTDQPTEESFILRYTASDRKGNAARVVTRQVAVVDPCGWPASACPGNGSTVICETCVDSSASASGYSCLCISGDEGVDEDWEGEAATPSLDKVSPSLTLDTGEGTPVTLSGVRVIVHCLYVNAPWIEPGYSASDNVDGDVTAQICVNSTQAVDATSSSPPELALVGPELITVNEGDYYGPCGLSYPAGAVCDHGATATDSLDGDLADHITACETETETNLFKVRGLSGCPLDTRTPGLYNITFAAANSAGLRAAAVRQLLVMINCVSYEHRCSSLLECSVNGLCQSDLGGGGESAQPAENSAPNLTVVEAGATPQYVDVKRFYELAVKGLASCIDTSAEVGTQSAIEFEVCDDSAPSLCSRAYRYVTITTPCEVTGEVWCGGTDGECSPVSCEERQALLDLTLRRRRRRLHADASDPQGLQSLVTGLQDGYATLGESLSQLALTVGGGGGSASVWESQVMDTWAAALKSETTHQDNLLSSIEQAIENQDAILEAVELQNEALAATETAMAEAEAQQSALWVAASDLEDAAMQMGEINLLPEMISPSPPPPGLSCSLEYDTRNFFFDVPSIPLPAPEAASLSAEGADTIPTPPQAPPPPHSLLEDASETMGGRRILARGGGGGGGGGSNVEVKGAGDEVEVEEITSLAALSVDSSYKAGLPTISLQVSLLLPACVPINLLKCYMRVPINLLKC
eukprot:gene945-1462_t